MTHHDKDAAYPAGNAPPTDCAWGKRRPDRLDETHAGQQPSQHTPLGQGGGRIEEDEAPTSVLGEEGMAACDSLSCGQVHALPSAHV